MGVRNFKKAFILILIISIIFSISIVSAEGNETSQDIFSQTDDIEINEDTIIQTTENSLQKTSEEDIHSQNGEMEVEEILGEEDVRIIYIGQNSTSDGGNGSYENPFATLNIASTNTSGENKVIVNIFNGTYELGSVLKFNTSNLVIQGITGKVIIKSTNTSTSKAIQLMSSSGNFEMNNITFDASLHPKFINEYIGPFFYPFSGNANHGTFKNCSFIGFKNSRITGAEEYNVKFVNCLFEGFNGHLFSGMLKEKKKFVYFKNCIFLNKDLDSLAMITYTYKNITFDGVWFGQNSIPEYVFSGDQLEGSGTTSGVHVAKITRYAIFSVHENYLGNNQYEIIGKLTWNDNTVEGIEGFNPMMVTLSSDTGEIQNNIILVNGTFKALYNSNSSIHSVTAQLDYEKITLNFNTINMQLNSPSIYYGDDENITMNFNQPVNGILNIIVGNKTYNATTDGTNSFTYKIEDTLTEGKYPINVFLNDLTNHVHAYGSTELVISKVTDFTFDSIVSSLVNVGCNTTILVELPEDATGTVTVVVGDNNFTQNASKSTEIEVYGFIEGDNKITVAYSGDNKYVPQSKFEIITAEKVELKLDNTNLSIETPIGTNTPIFSLVLPNDATGNLTITIAGKNYTQKLVKGSATLSINGLAPGKYDAIITYSGDSKYEKVVSNAFVSVSKPTITAKDFSMLYTSGSKYTVRVTIDGKPVSGKTVTFIVNAK